MSLFVLPAKGKKYSKVFVADMQVLCGAFFFGIGFLGQRAVSVHGLGTMTCNAFRFGLSTILLVACLPLIPPDDEASGVDGEEGDSEHRDKDAKTPISPGFEKETHAHAHAHTHGKKSDPGGSDGDGSGASGDSRSERGGGVEKEKPSEMMVMLTRILGPQLTNYSQMRKTVWFWGVLLGVINFGASGFQQLGIHYTSASKVAFIAGFDLFLTPILGLFIPTFKRNAKVNPQTWFAVCTSLIGIYQLSGTNIGELEFGHGETLTLISTVFWTLHITYTDIATNYVDSLSMMCVQLGVVTLLSSCAAIALEPQQWLWDHIFLFLPWLIFLAISEGLGFTLMAVGQNYSPPTHAAIILSLEGVFAAVSSFLFLGETLSWRELSGCFLMLMSTLIAELANVKHVTPAAAAAAAAKELAESEGSSTSIASSSAASSSIISIPTGGGGGSQTTFQMLTTLILGSKSQDTDADNVELLAVVHEEESDDGSSINV